MTTTSTIQQLLNWTDKEYSQHIFNAYVRWCESIAVKNDIADLQKIIANTAINRYFNLRFEDLENQAIEILKPQALKITIEAARRIYHSVMVDLFSMFPKPLVTAARKLNITGKNDYNDPRSN
jgi:hypothetical protein